jgi:hypothetical protein
MTVGVENYGLSRQFLRKKSANILLKFFLAFFCGFSEFSATKQTKVKQKSQKQKYLAVPKMI